MARRAPASKPSQNGTQPTRVYREFQFVVQPIVLVDDGGVPWPEQGEPFVVTGIKGLVEYADKFPAALEHLNHPD